MNRPRQIRLIACIAIAMALLAGCAGPGGWRLFEEGQLLIPPSAPKAEPTTAKPAATTAPAPTTAPAAAPTTAPAAANTPTPLPSQGTPAPPAATQVPAPTATTTGNPAGSGQRQTTSASCNNHGTVAWHAPTQLNDALYGVNVLGGVDEACWVVSQTWTHLGGKVRFAFALRPNTTIRWSSYVSGTGWYFGGSDADVRANLAQQLDQIHRRGDLAMEEYIVVLPDDEVAGSPGHANYLKFKRLLVELIPPRGATGAQATAAPTGQAANPAATAISTTAGNCSTTACTGPAIVENAAKKTLFNVGAGQVAEIGGGAFWTFPQQVALDAEWPSHLSRFQARPDTKGAAVVVLAPKP